MERVENTFRRRRQQTMNSLGDCVVSQIVYLYYRRPARAPQGIGQHAMDAAGGLDAARIIGIAKNGDLEIAREPSGPKV